MRNVAAVLMYEKAGPAGSRTKAGPILNLHFTRRGNRLEIQSIYGWNQEWLLGRIER